MGIGGGGTRSSLAPTRRCTTPAPPGRWQKPGCDWSMTRSPPPPPVASARPLLHTLAYAIRGFLEGGRALGDSGLVNTAERTARALAETVRADGWMPGRYCADWSPAVRWSCLTGEAQMANNWIRLAEITRDAQWLEPVFAVLRFLKRTQNRRSREPGLRGGIKGAWPVGGGYGAYEVLSWATKFFADALMRHEAIESRGLGAGSTVSVLA